MDVAGRKGIDPIATRRPAAPAQHGHASDHLTVRFSKRAAERGWMGTSAFAHLDFERSEIERLTRETLEITGRKIAPFRRQVLLQTWRVITSPPQDMPLAICDGRSVSTSEMIRMDFVGAKGSRNERVRSRACRFDRKHAWYYLPDMTRTKYSCSRALTPPILTP